MADNIILGNVNIATNLWLNNPYANGTVFTFFNGDVQLTRDQLVYVQSPSDTTYTILQGDDLWSIAYNKLGDSKWYWVLQEINRYLMAMDIEVGDSIIIPDLSFLFANQPN